MRNPTELRTILANCERFSHTLSRRKNTFELRRVSPRESMLFTTEELAAVHPWLPLALCEVTKRHKVVSAILAHAMLQHWENPWLFTYRGQARNVLRVHAISPLLNEYQQVLFDGYRVAQFKTDAVPSGVTYPKELTTVPVTLSNEEMVQYFPDWENRLAIAQGMGFPAEACAAFACPPPYNQPPGATITLPELIAE